MEFRKKLYLRLGFIFVVLVGIIAQNYFVYQELVSLNQSIYQNHVFPAKITNTILNNLNDVKFRMASYLGEVLPAAGSAKKLDVSKRKIIEEWSHYKDIFKGIQKKGESQADVLKLDGKINTIGTFFSLIKESYLTDSREDIFDILENKWPFFYSDIVVPLSEINEHHKRNSQSLFIKAQKLNQRNILFSLFLSIFGVITIVAIGVNIKKLLTNYGQLQKDNEIKSRLSSLGEMAGGIAHEINNPLCIIAGTNRTIEMKLKKNSLSNDDGLNYTATISETVDRIVKIINGLRTLTRDSSNENPTTCSLEDLFNDILGVCQERCKAQGIELLIPSHDLLKTHDVYCKRIQVSQVLLNLITNSTDALLENDNIKGKWIKLSFESSSSVIRLKITDSGNGIPEKVRNKIFEPFFTTKEVGKGTGLGLSLSHTIIKKHNGNLFIDTNCKNTCFVIELPQNPQKAAA